MSLSLSGNECQPLRPSFLYSLCHGFISYRQWLAMQRNKSIIPTIHYQHKHSSLLAQTSISDFYTTHCRDLHHPDGPGSSLHMLTCWPHLQHIVRSRGHLCDQILQAKQVSSSPFSDFEGLWASRGARPDYCLWTYPRETMSSLRQARL